MLQFKEYRKLKGSIAIYILIWGMLLLTIALLSLNLECERRKSLINFQKQVMFNEQSNTFREYLFSCLVKRIEEANVTITQDCVDLYIYNNYSMLSFPDCNDTSEFRYKCKLYIKEDKRIIITYEDESGNKRFECYKIKVIDSKVKFFIVQDGVLPDGNNL